MSETSSYRVPKFVVKPAADDTGYELVRKSYNRFLWTWTDYAKRKPNMPCANESDEFNAFGGEVPSSPLDYPEGTIGYGGPLKTGDFMSTDDYMDPDERKAMKNLLLFDDFNPVHK